MDQNASGEESANIDWTTDDELEILAETGASSTPVLGTDGVAVNPGNMEASSSMGVCHSNLVEQFVGMGFSKQLVLKAIEENGENTDLILNALLTYSNLEGSPQQQLSINCGQSSSDYKETIPDDLSDIDSWSENETADCDDSISGKRKMPLSLENTVSSSDEEKKLLSLANMGYTIEEASVAIEKCGPETSIVVLTDYICAAQVAKEEGNVHEDDLKQKYVCNGNSENKKRKLYEASKRKDDFEEETIRLPYPMIGYGVPSEQHGYVHRSLPEEARGPPYFYYENVALAPKGVWDTISRFLYEIEPEFVDSKYFSATARKRGYIHNLPIEDRFPLIPIPPLTIHEAFPLTKKWWPSWDKREKLNCIQTAIASAKLTERIRAALESYGGDPPLSVQKFVLEQCRKWNLVWVGRNKVAPLEADEMEMLLGFPKNHTRGGGISRTDRVKSLGNSFQVNTVAYHLSVLKDIYPNGINVLSLFSGIGGGEVALHRLGIKLKNVVSVEKSKGNRDIVRSWWEQTNQTGNLIDFEDIQQVDSKKLEMVMNSIGCFDLIIGGSPCNNLSGGNRISRDGLEGKESSLFYEYFRILELVKSYTPPSS